MHLMLNSGSHQGMIVVWIKLQVAVELNKRMSKVVVKSCLGLGLSCGEITPFLGDIRLLTGAVYVLKQ